MPHNPPTLIAIDHDDSHASHVGRTADGGQFFLTTPFIPALGKNVGREYVALYLFDAEGRLLEARIDDLGIRAELDEARYETIFNQRLAELRTVTYCRIEVQPFQLERFGTTFGLIVCVSDTEDGSRLWAELQPGNYMAFYEPWDSGTYDT